VEHFEDESVLALVESKILLVEASGASLAHLQTSLLKIADAL
jgi:hypothetical protein